MTVTINDFVKFVANRKPGELAEIIALGGRLSAIEIERAEIVAKLGEFGVSLTPPAEEVPSRYPGPTIATRRDVCAACNDDAVMTVDGNRYCETHGDQASAKKG